MASEELSIVRYLRFPERLRPLPIWLDQRVLADWAGIVHWHEARPGRTDAWNEYSVRFYRDDGTWLVDLGNPFGTLSIALEQARFELGIELTEWTGCNLQIEDPDHVPWAKVHPAS